MLIRRSVTVLCLALVGFMAASCDLLVAEIAEQGRGGGSSSGPATPPPSTGGGSGPAGTPDQGARDAGAAADASGTPGAGTGTSSCFGAGTAGAPPFDPAQCRSSGDWKQSASDSCTSQKANLVDLQLTQPCGGDLYAGMQYQCCTPSAGPPPDPTPPGPPVPSPPCFTAVLDDGAVCVAADALKTRASDACSKQGAVLTNLSFGGACADGQSFVGAKYQCCAVVTTPADPGTPVPTSPPGPTRSCSKASEGSSSSCKDSGTWKTDAASTCTTGGRVLTELSPRDACGPDLYRFIDYVCCTP